MSDYTSTWAARQRYYSDQAVARRDELELQAEQDRAELQEAQSPAPAEGEGSSDLLSPDLIGAGLRREVTQPTGRASETGQALETFGENVGERALDAVPSIGVGMIAMADNVLDFGAHVAGLEEHYAEASRWLGERVDLHEPTTSTGPVVAAISQLVTPFIGTAKALQVAGVSRVLSNVVAAGTADGLAIAPADANFAEVIKGFVAAEPDAPAAVHNALLDAMSKTPDELRILALAQARAETGESLTEIDPASGFDPEAYREVYFESRLKNATAGMTLELFAEALIVGARGIFRTGKALADPEARKALGRTLRRSTDELSSSAPQSQTLAGATGVDGLTPAAAARAALASPVDSAEQIMREAAQVRAVTEARNLAVASTPPRAGAEAPSGRLLAALAGTGAAGSATAASGLAAPAGTNQDDLRAWLGVLGGELGRDSLTARRFNYLPEPPEDMTGKGTSVLYRGENAPDGRQIERFRERLGGRYVVDVREAGGGHVLDVHPSEGQPADPALLEAAVLDAGLDPNSAQIVFSEYSQVTVDRAEGAASMDRWRSSLERKEAKAFAAQVGGMAVARAILRGEEKIPDGVRGGKRSRLRGVIDKAKARVNGRVTAAEKARAGVRHELDEEARRTLLTEDAP